MRERAVAHYFGVGAFSDVFQSALRGPNLLQNLLGEQSLSAAFIPIYSRKLAAGRPEEAGRFAGAIFGLLLSVTAGLALVGVLFARPLVTVLLPGYLGDAAAVEAGEATVDRFELAVTAVRILFPMAGFAVLAAWCLGVLNSHRRFFLPYVAPVVWNVSVIAGLVWVGQSLVAGGASGPTPRLLYAGCLGALVGGALQFLVQLPLVLRVMEGFRPTLSTRVEGVREAFRNFAPVVAGRGVVQLSAYLDMFLASFLMPGAQGALGYALRLYGLPVGLFGISIAAAELPELSRAEESDEGAEVAQRTARAFRRMVFFTLPTVLGYLVFGYLFVGALYRTGTFESVDNWLVYFVLGAYSVGILPNTASRLLQSVFYAVKETRTPARIAAVRVAFSTAVGIGLMIWLDRARVAEVVGLEGAEKDLRLGALGLAVAAGVSAWLELLLLQRALHRHVAAFRLPWRRLLPMALTALVALLPSAVVWLAVRRLPILLQAAAVLTVYAGIYLVGARLGGVREAEGFWRRIGGGERGGR